jgi:DNA uptake protein ComE-like DNA-binding protein
MTIRKLLGFALVATLLVFGASAAMYAQVGKGVIDANTATEAELTTAPHVTPAIAKALIAKRTEKFLGSITELNAFLLSSGLTQAQAMETYSKIFIHVDLNTCTREEILLIPGAGTRMAREFPEYRPWTSWAQFDKEIGKYVQAEGVARLKPYVFIPVDLNRATDEDILSIPGAGNRMVREFKEYRPWTTKAQFDKEIGKYVGQKETERLWRFVVIK